MAFYSQNLHGCGMASPTPINERNSSVSNSKSAVDNCTVLDSPRLLVHDRFRRPHGKKNNPGNGILLHDCLHVRACYSKCGSGFCGGNHIAFLVLYAFTFFFSDFGPNATTFVVPAEIFPARIRSTCHGISAAAGKAGAVIGALGFVFAAESTRKAEVDPGYHKGIGIKSNKCSGFALHVPDP